MAKRCVRCRDGILILGDLCGLCEKELKLRIAKLIKEFKNESVTLDRKPVPSDEDLRELARRLGA